MSYKLIYCAIIDDPKHQNMIKVGDTDFTPTKKLTAYDPNDLELQKAADSRIKGWSGTAAAGAKRIWCDILIRFNENTGNYEDFRDGEVHKVLQNAGFPKVEFDSSLDSGREWFEVDLETVKAATKAAKEYRDYLTASEMPVKTIYELRDEQKEAVEKTYKRFKTADDMLWHAKMRFGKTITALNLVKKEGYKRTIIITHRPVVEDSWGGDFYHVFGKEDDYIFLTKISDATGNYSDDFTDSIIDKANDERLLKLYCEDKPIVYFASIQDLRGSRIVGGKFDKNKTVFDIDWDLVIIDEAHEGTKTELGQNVITQLIKIETKKLDLSGTAYNLLDKYSDDKSVFTWDYVMEQQAKKDWLINHPGEPNPYADMPVMHINTFDLQKALKERHIDISEKAFTFHEFFRTWTGDMSKDGQPIPAGFEKGDFVHRDAVKHFFDLLCTNEESSRFPFVDISGCKQNTHTLWMVPGVKEAAAVSDMLKKHPFFSMFGIANVAGEGDHDEETHFQNALNYVRKTIENNDRSITISCGRLTTGVTVKEWSSVFMLSGSDNTDAKQYMQTIFRVQSAGKINGVQKTDCYVYDFAPDRALIVVAEVAGSRRSTRGGVVIGDDGQKQAFEEFLNFCPIVAIDGAEFKPFSVEDLVSQINRVHIDRALKTGFMDNCIYDMAKFKVLTGNDIDKLNSIFGKMKSTAKKPPLSKAGTAQSGAGKKQTGKTDTSNDTGKDKVKQGNEEAKAQRKMIQDLLDRLRTVSIRIPLLFYGGDFEIEEGRLADVIIGISDASWNVFMPGNLSKKDFRELVQYYNQETVVGAAKVIRSKAAEADLLPPTERVIAITNIFESFHNPSHETVLTPWHVVNIHMAEALGGYRFYNAKYEENDDEYYRRLQEPELVDKGNVTKETLGNANAQILEINSKTGLYPLYCAYSIYRAKLKERGKTEAEYTPEQLLSIWDEACSQIYVLCQSEMSVSITRHTLYGNWRKIDNILTDDKLLDALKTDIPKYAKKVLKGRFWGKGDDKVEFDAVVGNPPYQLENEGDGYGKDPIYHLFIDLGMQLCDKGTFIHPGRFLFNAGKTPKYWNNKMLHNNHYKVIAYWPDSTNVFPTVDVKGGIAITYWNNESNFGEIGFFSTFEELRSITTKVVQRVDYLPFSEFVYPRDLYQVTEELYTENTWAENRQSKGHRYDLGSNVFDVFPELFFDEKPSDNEEFAQICGRANNRRYFKWIKKKYLKTPDNFSYYKVLIPKSNGSGAFGEVLSMPVVGQPVVGHTVTFLSIGKFDTQLEAEAVLSYIKTKFARTLLGTLKVTQDNPRKVWGNIPLQKFSKESDIDWSQSISDIDKQLYKKYGLSDKEIDFIEKNVKPMDDSSTIDDTESYE